MDLKKSGISGRTKKTHRVTLPRLSDVVRDLLTLLSTRNCHQTVEVFVLDFADAYWQIPLEPNERRHFIGFDGKNLWVYLRSAQGSRNGPLSWAGPSSLLFRCTQGGLSVMSDDPASPETRSHLYVDDPALAIRGTEEFRDDAVAITVLIWSLLGFKMAFDKAQRGTDVIWIGGHIRILDDRVIVSIPEEICQEFQRDPQHQRRLHPSCPDSRRQGSELWGALQEASAPTKRFTGPNGCLWTKQILPALMWFKAFLNNRAGALRITYLVSAFKNSGRKVRIVGDAFVYGMGAHLMIDDIIVSWYATALSNHDEKLLNVQIGDEKHQQVAESLNLLVALRTWKLHWCLERVQLEVRADNMTALNLILRLKG